MSGTSKEVHSCKNLIKLSELKNQQETLSDKTCNIFMVFRFFWEYQLISINQKKGIKIDGP